MALGLIAICLSPLLLPWYLCLIQHLRPAIMVEEITLPTRFLTTIGHLVTTLTVFYDLENIVSRSIGVDVKQDEHDSEKLQLLALTVVAIICFLVEFGGTFAGISLFLPKVNGLYIWLHFVGAVLVSLFISQHWRLFWYIYIVIFCSILPAIVEIMVAFALFKLKMMEYS